MANIETEFNNMVQGIGSDTISAIATSGPEMLCTVCICVCVHSFMSCIRAHVCA